jgi:drug/metabolite transporter (DMT)-like permease
MSPVYGILLAVIFLDEYPSLITVLGGFVIVSTVVIEAMRVKNADKKLSN